MTSKPAIVLVTGAWHTPAHYKSFIDLLTSRGYQVLCPRLPTCEPKWSSTTRPGMHSDATRIRDELQRLIYVDGRDVLLVPHSYGGVPGLQAVEKSMAKLERRQLDKKGGIIGILSLCAFIIPTNTSLEDLTNGKPAPFINVKENGMTTAKDPKNLFFHDLPAESQKIYASELVEQPAIAHASKVTINPIAYKYLPVGVVICEDDRATAPAVQEIVIQNMRNDGGTQIREYRLACSHSPHLSRAEELYNIVGQFLDTLNV